MSRARGRTVLALALAVTLVACDGAGSRRKGQPPTSALLVTIGGLRADRTNAYLYERPTTYIPSTEEERVRGEDLSFDDVAAQGVSFAFAFAPSGSAAASLTAIHSGLHPLSTCVLAATDPVPADVPLLAERFRDAGYRSAVRASGLELQAGVGLGRGFEAFTPNATDEEALASAQDWIEAVGDEPFFLWIHLRGPEALESLEGAAYDEALARTSARLRTFFRWLAGADGSTVQRLNSTALVVTAPTGTEFGEHGFTGHRRSLYDAGLRVPLVLRHPPSLTGRRVFDGVVSTERIAGTFADWCGLPPRPGDESLLGRVDGRVEADPDAALLATAAGVGFSLRTNDMRLVFEGAAGPEEGEAPRVQLFETRRDPRELVDLAPQRPEELKRLVERLGERIEAAGTACLAPGTLEALERLARP